MQRAAAGGPHRCPPPLLLFETPMANSIMNSVRGWLGSFAAWLLLGSVMVVLSGCASTPKPDWDQRVGHYTFEQAVQELGPPFSSVLLDDGTRVAEWFLKAGPQFSFGVGSGFGGGHGGVGVGTGVTTPPKGHYLRLTFGLEGQLQKWEKVKR